MKAAWAWLYANLQLACRFKIELWSSLTALGWGIWLFLDHDPMTGNPAYTVTTALFETDTWRFIAVAVGGVQLCSVMGDYRWGRVACAGIASCLWGTLGYSFFLSASSTPGMMVYLGWAMTNAHSMARDVHKRPVSL